MRKSTSIVSLLLITLAAVAAAWFWALAPLAGFDVLNWPPRTDADLVRYLWHFRLVQPEWVSNPPNYSYGRWEEAEVLARLTVVFLGWITSNILADRISLRNREITLTNKRIGACVLVAILLSYFSFAILWLEYGVLNFGDSDLPPYQPDTPFEKTFDAVWFTITIGAGLLWSYVIALLFRAFKRRVA
jgi:hypothetical protein